MSKTEFTVPTSERACLVDITAKVAKAVEQSGIPEGLATVFIPHTTAAVTINENADPDVIHDLLWKLEKLVPRTESAYQHSEGNSDAHVKASLVGSSVAVLVEGGRLVLGTWQGVYFCEFDGPRTRRVLVTVTPS